MSRLSPELWKKLDSGNSPFLNYHFHHALEISGSVGEDSGWLPLHLVAADNQAALISYFKTHSYGEYIFDWGWAEAYQCSGLNYYPKLTSMIPFTPATVPHFLMNEFNPNAAAELLGALQEIYQQNNFSSNHFLFLTDEEIPLFQDHDFLIRESIQFHFFNQGYSDFEDYLGRMKAKKAKHIREERNIPEVEICRYTGDSLTKIHAANMYQFYLSTIDKKNASDYLKEDFFSQIFHSMKEQILYVEASLNQKAIAGALFFYGNQRLYGRYWGSNTFVEHLHFELCFYQGIEFCLEKKLKVFEAGAQGEHKIQRGFKPIRTYSAHHIKHPGFRQAIAQFIDQEKIHLADTISELEKRLPFKESQ